MSGSSNDPFIRGKDFEKQNKDAPLSDDVLDAIFNPPPDLLDNLPLKRALGIMPDSEPHEAGELREALEMRVPRSVFQLANRSGAETPLGIREEDGHYMGRRISSFELRRPDGSYVIPDAEMLGAPIAPPEAGEMRDRSGSAKKYLATVDHSGRVDETSLETVSSGTANVILIERPLEKGGGFDVEVQVRGMDVAEELLKRIDQKKESPEHYRSSYARFSLDRAINEHIREHIGGAELLEEPQYLKIERIKDSSPEVALFNVAVAVPAAGVFDGNYEALEIKGIAIMLGEDRLFRFSGGERNSAGPASEYNL